MFVLSKSTIVEIQLVLKTGSGQYQDVNLQ